MNLKNLAVIAALSLAAADGASAQNVVITNARIIDGTGKVIEHGSVIAKDGKITSVASGNAAGAGGTRIDAHA